MRLPTLLPLPLVVAVFTTPAVASWHVVLPRQTDPSAPTSVQTGEALENCLWTSHKIRISQPTEPPGLAEYRSSAITEAARHPFYSSAVGPVERLDRTSVCSLYIGISSRELTILPSELSKVFSAYSQAKTSWVEEVKPRVSEYSKECVGVVGTSEVGEFLQEFATDVEGCVTNAEMIFGKFVTATLTETRADVEDSASTDEWKALTASMTTTDSTAAGARETGYLVPVLGFAGAVAWAGAAVV
ncbi:hypothetical protein QBC36DRAFT_362106 [Triangularia setosa]|uniref:Uncharacterized protein n=1 Tax=Triangularia setosa TaxID=2587417 RepID=A0AAN7AB06_9PEZI|nr:hypothetical protein QBC36DRAFT_362106 [Podospora setosa]